MGGSGHAGKPECTNRYPPAPHNRYTRHPHSHRGLRPRVARRQRARTRSLLHQIQRAGGGKSHRRAVTQAVEPAEGPGVKDSKVAVRDNDFPLRLRSRDQREGISRGNPAVSSIQHRFRGVHAEQKQPTAVLTCMTNSRIHHETQRWSRFSRPQSVCQTEPEARGWVGGSADEPAMVGARKSAYSSRQCPAATHKPSDCGAASASHSRTRNVESMKPILWQAAGRSTRRGGFESASPREIRGKLPRTHPRRLKLALKASS